MNNALSRGTAHLVAFNQPDLSNQANMSVHKAVNVYRQFLVPFGNAVLLGAPAVSNGENGLKRLANISSVCSGCQVDFVPTH